MIAGAARFWMGFRGLLLAMAVLMSAMIVMPVPWAIAEGVPEDEWSEVVVVLAVMVGLAVFWLAVLAGVASPRSWWVTFRYACLEALSLSFLSLAMACFFVPLVIDPARSLTLVMMFIAAIITAALFVLAWFKTRDGMARWRRRRALRLLMSAPTHGRPHVSVGRVEDSVRAGRWMRMMQVGYVPNGSGPHWFWTLGWNDPPTLMLVTYNPSRPGAVRDVVSVSADSLREHGWDFS